MIDVSRSKSVLLHGENVLVVKKKNQSNTFPHDTMLAEEFDNKNFLSLPHFNVPNVIFQPRRNDGSEA